jgi:hypothetical protein
MKDMIFAIVIVCILALGVFVIGQTESEIEALEAEIVILKSSQSLLNPPPDTILTFLVKRPDSTSFSLPFLTYKELYNEATK